MKKICGETSTEKPKRNPKKKTETFTGGNSEDILEEIPGGMPGEISRRTLEELFVGIHDGITKGINCWRNSPMHPCIRNCKKCEGIVQGIPHALLGTCSETTTIGTPQDVYGRFHEEEILDKGLE